MIITERLEDRRARYYLFVKDTWRLFTAVLLITAGGLIYILFRSRQTILNEFVGDEWTWLEQLRSLAACWLTERGNIGEFVVYCLPGALWVSSYILFIDAFYQSAAPAVRFCRAMLVPLIGVISELLQACFPTGYMFCNIHIGNYAPLDLLCYLIPLALYYVFLNYRKLYKLLMKQTIWN